MHTCTTDTTTAAELLGLGFTFDDTDRSGIASSIAVMRELIRNDPRNAERIFPYIGGEEVNDSPTHSPHRFVIDFRQMSEEEAHAWPDLWSLLERRVHPQRSLANRDAHRNRWWQHADPRPGLYDSIRGLDRVLVCTLHQEHWALTFLPSGVVFSHALGVIATDNLAQSCILQCRVHEAWARFFGSSLEERFRYTPSNCFETFPFPIGSVNSTTLESPAASTTSSVPL